MSARAGWMALFGLACLAVGAVGAAEPAPCKKKANRTQEERLIAVTYPVADLVIPISPTGQGPSPATAEDSLIKLIQSTVAPASWSAAGGSGTLDYHPLTMALVVNQTVACQEDVAQLLSALRRLQELSVCLEMRIVEMEPDLAECFLREAAFEETKQEGGEGSVKTAFLDDEQMRQWLELFQGSRATNVMQAPKLTLFNGQKAEVRALSQQPFVTDYKATQVDGQVAVTPQKEVIETGMRAEFQPVVSADRRYVRLDLNVKLTSLDETVPVFPVTVKVGRCGEEKEYQGFAAQPKVQTLALKSLCTIPDGRTAAFSLGSKLVEVRNESGPPILTRIPYVSRLFKNAGYGREAHAVFVFVTPRILVQEEEEQRIVQTGGEVAEGKASEAAAPASKVKKETEMVERLLSARKDHQQTLESLRAYYIATGDIEKARWAEEELLHFHRLPKHAFILARDVPPPSLNGTHNIPEANELYRKAVSYKGKGWGTDYIDNQRRAELLLQQLLTDFPQSDKISDTAYQLGDLYEGKAYKQYARAAAYFERCFQWNPRTRYDARIRAARIYDKVLHDRSRAAELYREITTHEVDERQIEEAQRRLSDIGARR